MKWERLCELGRELPEVDEGIWFRTPALQVRGKSFVRLKEDGRSVVFRLGSVEERHLLTETAPDIYFITDHYRGWPAVLARLAALDTAEARRQLEVSWRVRAPKALVAAHDGHPPAAARRRSSAHGSAAPSPPAEGAARARRAGAGASAPGRRRSGPGRARPAR